MTVLPSGWKCSPVHLRITGRKKVATAVSSKAAPRSRLRICVWVPVAPNLLIVKMVMIAAGMLPIARPMTIRQSTVWRDPWTAVPTLLVTEA